MKICSFCNTENANDAVKCSSCGANSFRYKCDNCGTEFTEGVHCPHCGVKIGQEARMCPSCKTKYYSTACPTCGYVPRRTAATATVPVNVPVQSVQPEKPKRKTWLWVLGWIFIFPLPLTLILLKKQNMSKGLKYGIILAAWVLYLIIGFSAGASKNDDQQNGGALKAQETTVVTEVETVKATDKATEAPTEPEPTEEPTEKPTKEPTEAPSPIEIYEYTYKVEAGSEAFVTIQAEPNTEYSIHVYYSTGESKADGLENQTTDGDGFATWRWKVGTNTAPGTYSITVKGGGTSEKVEFDVYN